MTQSLKKYFCRLPQACVDLIKFEAARVGAGYSTSRALVQKILEDFLGEAPWRAIGWEFPFVSDVRKYGGDKTGSVQFNIFVSSELGGRVDEAIEDSSATKASFFLAAICWWLNKNLTDPQAKKLFADAVRSLEYRTCRIEEDDEDEDLPDAGNKEVLKSRQKKSVSKDSSTSHLAAIMKNKHLPEYDNLYMPTTNGDVLETVQGRATSGLVSWEQVNTEISRLKVITDEYGSEADGSSFWFVGPENGSDSTSFRKRATMVVLRVTNGEWKIARCYRSNVRAKSSQSNNLTLAPMVHARRGEKALNDYVSGETRVMFPSAGDFLRKQCATESMNFWLGFLIRAVAKDVIKPDEVALIASWRMNKPGVSEVEVLHFGREIFPRINGGQTWDVVSLIDGGCADETSIIKAMARSTHRISDPG